MAGGKARLASSGHRRPQQCRPLGGSQLPPLRRWPGLLFCWLFAIRAENVPMWILGPPAPPHSFLGKKGAWLWGAALPTPRHPALTTQSLRGDNLYIERDTHMLTYTRYSERLRVLPGTRAP